MTSPSYAPLEVDTSVYNGGSSGRYDDFANESKHHSQATYSTISGHSSFSIPRKPLPSGDMLAQASPLPFSQPWYKTWVHGALDLCTCLAPLTFFTLAWCAYRLAGKDTSAWGASVQEWSLIAPTIFPIVFAAVVARSTHSTANFLLERGVSLITLEQLVRSNSISNALTTQIGLHTVTVLGMALMLLWALSPAGSQASLRLLSITTRDINSMTFVAYMNSANTTSMLFDDLQTSFVYGEVDGVYSAALLGSPDIKGSPQDSWNNVKIPDMAYLNTSAADIDGWLPVPDGDVKYSSLLGHPVAGVPTSGSTSFLLNSYYYKIQCQKLWHVEFNSTGAIYDWYTPLGLSSFNDVLNVTTVFKPVAQSFATLDTSFFISRYMASFSEDTINTRFPSIFLGSQFGGDGAYSPVGMSFANCTMEPVFVESKVSCTGIKCAVTKMRRAQPYSKTAYFWNSDLMSSGNTEYFDMFSQELAFAIPGMYYGNYQSTPTEVYMSGEELYPYSAAPMAGQVKLYESPIDDLARRFTTIVNTYWLASMASGSFWTGSFWSAPMADITCAINNCSGSLLYGTQVAGGIYPQNATAQVTHTLDIYECHVWWLITLVVASTLLFGLGVAGVVLRWMTRGPDVLGYASSLARDNPYVRVNAYGSAMDGLDYTRELAGLKVRLLDVRPDDKYGHIAVTSEVDARGGRSVGLLKGRLYI